MKEDDPTPLIESLRADAALFAVALERRMAIVDQEYANDPGSILNSVLTMIASVATDGQAMRQRIGELLQAVFEDKPVEAAEMQEALQRFVNLMTALRLAADHALAAIERLADDVLALQPEAPCKEN